MQEQFTETINTPIEHAFATIEDDRKIERWMHGDITTEYLNYRDPKNPVGTKFRQKIRGMFDLEGEVIAYHKPTLLGIGWKTGILQGTLFYHFKKESDTVTTLVCDMEIFDGTGILKSIRKVLYPLFTKALEKQMKGLKDIAEDKVMSI